MVVLTDEADIDEWFQEEKERLSERFRKALDTGADFSKERDSFDKQYQKLFAEYQKKFLIAKRALARRERLERPFKRFRAWKKRKMQAFAFWRKLSKERYTKWRFEREYRKLFHIKKKKI